MSNQNKTIDINAIISDSDIQVALRIGLTRMIDDANNGTCAGSKSKFARLKSALESL